jgi:Prolyl-tRNA synthetase
MRRGIEVGHVFQLGQKYSDAMDATVLDEHGKQATLFMGCYGIGITRIVAAAIEQRHDDRGICWPASLSPFDVCIVPIGGNKNPIVDQEAINIKETLEARGLEVLLDDRNLGPGPRFADMDLIGIPLRIVVSGKTIESGEVELKHRTEDEAQRVSREAIVDTIMESEWLRS